MAQGTMADAWGRERLLEALDAYGRGLTEAPLVRKWSAGTVAAAPDAGEQTLAFVISTPEPDRHGDIIEAAGWQLDGYRRNPVVLWAHDYARPVIGRAAAVQAEPGRLVARLEFAPTPFAQEVATLYRQGYQRGVSVGFRPLRYAERRDERTGALLGVRFLEQELLEISAVPVPANPSALRRALAEAPLLGEWLRSAAPACLGALREARWPELAARIDDLGKLAAELAELAAGAEAGRLPGETGLTAAEVAAALREGMRFQV